MAFTISSVEYYYANVRDELGAAYRVLSQLAELGVNLLGDGLRDIVDPRSGGARS